MTVRVAGRLGRREADSFVLEVDLEVADGQTTVVVGPNGSGKTTLLELIAGLAGLDEGSVEVGGAVVDDPAAGIFVPPEARTIGFVFQEHLLFPHMSALENVAFGPRCKGVRRSEAQRRAGDWLERLGLSEHADSRPGALSGGQAQRVALARALASDPAVLLLDEPLSALDVQVRDQVRRDLRTHLDSFAGPRLLVTHDPVEAMTLGDRVIVLEGGAITHDATMAELARRPRTPYVARLVGLNVYRGRWAGATFTVDAGGTLVGVADEAFSGQAVATVRPQAVALHRSRPEGTPRNVWRGRVRGVEQTGDRIRVAIDAQPSIVAEITAAALADLTLAVGDEVWVSTKATDVHLSPV